MTKPLKDFLRWSLRMVCAAGLRSRSRPLQLSATGPILILAPHSDDEALGCAGLISDRTSRSAIVHVAYFTDSAGRHRNPALAATRQAEATAAMATLLVPADRLHWLGAPDGRLKDLSDEERRHWQVVLAQLISTLQPRELLLPSRADGSSEHEAMFRLVAAALPAVTHRPRILEFPVWSWWNPRFLWPQLWRADCVWRQPLGAHAARKQAALTCYRSQVLPAAPGRAADLSPEFLAAFATSHEYFFETKLPA